MINNDEIKIVKSSDHNAGHVDNADHLHINTIDAGHVNNAMNLIDDRLVVKIELQLAVGLITVWTSVSYYFQQVTSAMMK